MAEEVLTQQPETEAPPVDPALTHIPVWSETQRGLRLLRAALIALIVTDALGTTIAFTSFGSSVAPAFALASLVPWGLVLLATGRIERDVPDDASRRLARRALLLAGAAAAFAVPNVALGFGDHRPNAVAPAVLSLGATVFGALALGALFALFDRFAFVMGRLDVCVTYRRVPLLVVAMIVLDLLIFGVTLDLRAGRDSIALVFLTALGFMAAWFTLLGVILAMTARLRKVLPHESQVTRAFD